MVMKAGTSKGERTQYYIINTDCNCLPGHVAIFKVRSKPQLLEWLSPSVLLSHFLATQKQKKLLNCIIYLSYNQKEREREISVLVESWSSPLHECIISHESLVCWYGIWIPDSASNSEITIWRGNYRVHCGYYLRYGRSCVKVCLLIG